MWIASAEECREMDRQAGEMGISVEMLMHEAGRAVAACVLESFPEAKKIAVVCGKGNNGGDGLVAARLLAEHQKTVEVLIAATSAELNEHTARECDRMKEVGINPTFCSEKDWTSGKVSFKKSEVVVDALLGTGLKGVPLPNVSEAIGAINRSARLVVAVDVPSGVECDTGAVAGEAIYARHTVTFGLPKPFLFQGEGMVRAGTWSVAAIGIPEKILKQPRDAYLMTLEEVRRLMPSRSKLTNKHRQGSMLVVAGSRDMPGAAVLVARAGLRGGAGLVTVASVPSVCEAVSRHLPEALLFPLPERQGAIDPSAAEMLLERADKYKSVVVGPGLSLGDGVGEFLSRLFKNEKWSYCVDADALTWISRGVEMGGAFKRGWVLTPHEGEMARLLGIDAAEVRADRFAAMNSARGQFFGRAVILKGAHTLVGGYERRLTVNPTGNPGLATAGTGDVLSGLVGSLLLRHDGESAARLGAYWHGLAADMCAQEIGPAGYLASEVADMLPRARATITSSCKDV